MGYACRILAFRLLRLSPYPRPRCKNTTHLYIKCTKVILSSRSVILSQGYQSEYIWETFPKYICQGTHPPPQWIVSKDTYGKGPRWFWCVPWIRFSYSEYAIAALLSMAATGHAWLLSTHNSFYINYVLRW